MPEYRGRWSHQKKASEVTEITQQTQAAKTRSATGDVLPQIHCLIHKMEVGPAYTSTSFVTNTKIKNPTSRKEREKWGTLI